MTEREQQTYDIDALFAVQGVDSIRKGPEPFMQIPYGLNNSIGPEKSLGNYELSGSPWTK